MPEEKLTKDEMYQAAKEGAREGFKDLVKDTNENIGKWVVKAFLTSLIAAAIYFMLATNGWHHK